LERPHVGRNENFFALGGDSLLAMRMVEAVRQRFRLELTLRQLFAAPTISELAGIVAAHQHILEAGAIEEGVV
jgi:aryl carrier-like protein